MIGMILGNRYELLEVVGEGGMAVVYKAKDNKLNRWVAVKILKKEFADNEEISQKFKKEATAIANLSDMNIVNVIDVGHEEDENIDYFVMEFVDGKTLKDIIVFNGRLSYNTAITVAIQVAKALDCAHRSNIIHRDIKPQNILVTEHGDVKVTDFGIAKSSTASTITNTTTIMGSAHYLSPEQAKGTFIDIRTDLYSLGIVLYEMVTGKLPFQGDSPVTIALKHIQEQPIAPKELNDSLPDSLNNLILKAMHKEPISRYQTAKELIADLQKIKDNPNIMITNAAEDDGKTIVMAPIKVAPKEQKNKFSKFDEEDDDDEYYDDFEDEEDDDVKKPKKKKKKNSSKGKIIGIIVTIIILLAGGVLAFSMFNNKPQEVTIPNVVGKSESEAKKELEALGLKMEVIATKNSDEAKGNIIEMNPAEGTVVIEDTVINVTVSGGVETINIPDLRDYEINYIKQVLNDRGIAYDIVEEFSDNVEKGILISQSPERGSEVPKDTRMTIVISKGPEVKLVSVANYIGFKVEDAKKELEDLKLVVSIEERETDRKSEEGIVLDQSIQGTKVEEGTPIKLYVGKYVEPQINIRNYLSEGMYLGDAISALKAQAIEFVVEGGTPPQAELNNYKVATFTESISKGEKVTITVNKIEPPATGDNNNNDSNGN